MEFTFNSARAWAIAIIWLVIGAVILVPLFTNKTAVDYTSTTQQAISAALISTIVIAATSIKIHIGARKQ